MKHWLVLGVLLIVGVIIIILLFFNKPKFYKDIEISVCQRLMDKFRLQHPNIIPSDYSCTINMNDDYSYKATLQKIK